MTDKNFDHLLQFIYFHDVMYMSVLSGFKFKYLKFSITKNQSKNRWAFYFHIQKCVKKTSMNESKMNRTDQNVCDLVYIFLYFVFMYLLIMYWIQILYSIHIIINISFWIDFFWYYCFIRFIKLIIFFIYLNWFL